MALDLNGFTRNELRGIFQQVFKKPNGSHPSDFFVFERGLNEIEKATFRQYITHLHLEESRKSFFSSLKEKENIILYLKDFLDDTELEKLEFETFKNTKIDSKASTHSDLYDARNEKEWEKRILLWRATFSKATTPEDRRYLYGECLKNNLEELRDLKEQSIQNFRVKVYESFIKFLKRLNKKDFERFVDKAFEKDVDLKALMCCDSKTLGTKVSK